MDPRILLYVAAVAWLCFGWLLCFKTYPDVRKGPGGRKSHDVLLWSLLVLFWACIGASLVVLSLLAYQPK